MANPKTKRFIQRWHKRVGIVSAVFVLVLACTGVLLNHTSAFGLDRAYVGARWLLAVYGAEPVAVRAAAVNEGWLGQVGEQLWWLAPGRAAQPLGACEGPLIGAAGLAEYWVAACTREIQLYTVDLQRIEKIDSSYQMPLPLSAIAACEPYLCLRVAGDTYRADLNALTFSRRAAGADVPWSALARPPDELHMQLAALAEQHAISLEKLVLDIHAGRYLGSLGPLLMDLLAVLFIVFASSGVWLWLQNGLNPQHRRKRR